MKSKIQNSKPDIGSNQPLKAKSFPINLSMFQTSYTSSSSSKAFSASNSASQIQIRGSKISNMQPNLFQYNDRSPLLFSSDEDQPSFNYYQQMKETKKESILNATNDKINTQTNNKEKVKEQAKQQIPQKQEEEMEQKIQQVIINKIYINKSSGQFNNHKNQQLKPSVSQNILQKQQKQEQALKQKSQVLSKTDQIIEQVNFDQKKNILIEQSSNKSSERHSSYIRQSYQPTINRLSNEPTLPPRKRRNRIFDTNSKNRSSKQAYVTPQKGVQTQSNKNQVKEFDYSPQLKALDVLSKIVDQINPNPAKISQTNNFDWCLPFTDQLQDTIKLFRNIRSIEQIGQNHQQKIGSIMNKIKQMRATLAKRSNQTKYYSQVEQSILNNFKQLTQQFESIEQVVHNAIETRQRLQDLLQRSKGLMIMLQRKELKKIYYILQQIAVQTERLKQIKSTCGKYRLQNIFRQYLQAEINQLQDMHASMTATFKDTFPHFNL